MKQIGKMSQQSYKSEFVSSVYKIMLLWQS